MHSELATSTPSKSSSAIWTNYAQGVAWGTVVLALGVIVSYVMMITAVATENISLTAGMVIASVILYLGFTVAHEAGHGNISHEVQWMSGGIGSKLTNTFTKIM